MSAGHSTVEEPSVAPRRLVLLRHGQTDWNSQQRIQGQAESDLDETGHGQASAVARRLAGMEPVALWSSDLARARQTTAYLAKETGLDPAFDARLREYHLGERQGITHGEYAAAHAAEHEEFRRGNYDVVPDGERRKAVAARMAEAMRELLDAAGPGEVALAVSHGAALKVAIIELLGWPAEVAQSVQAVDNCGWAVLEEAEYAGRLRLMAYNVTASG